MASGSKKFRRKRLKRRPLPQRSKPMGLLQALAAVLSLLAGACSGRMGSAFSKAMAALLWALHQQMGWWRPPVLITRLVCGRAMTARHAGLEAHEAAVKSVIFAGDKYVISGGDDNVAIIWDRNAGALIHRLERARSQNHVCARLTRRRDDRYRQLGSPHWYLGCGDRLADTLAEGAYEQRQRHRLYLRRQADQRILRRYNPRMADR